MSNIKRCKMYREKDKHRKTEELVSIYKNYRNSRTKVIDKKTKKCDVIKENEENELKRSSVSSGSNSSIYEDLRNRGFKRVSRKDVVIVTVAVCFH